MLQSGTAAMPRLDPEKFRDPATTAGGERRAVVALTQLRTLWFNTGSLCNITCKNCYMDSGPHNDRLAYMTESEVAAYLDEVAAANWPVKEIAFTGGEPFMNPDILKMIEASLVRGHSVLVLTNAMKPLHHRRAGLLDLHRRFPDAMTIRVSIDHYTREGHEDIRGKNTWQPVIDCVQWLTANGFSLAVAGRTVWDEDEADARRRYAEFFAAHAIDIDAADPARLVLFPEMDESRDVPEITAECWDVLGVRPESVMCSTSRMIIKRKNAAGPVVVPCTLLPYDARFELGTRLADSARTVKLNHPHCARFCVLGGASCSTGQSERG